MQFLPNSTQRMILECIRDGGAVARSEIAGLTGINPGALSRLMRDLINAGLVHEGKRIRAGRGQPPLPLSLNPNAAWSVGLSFSLHEIEVVGIDFAGTCIAERVVPLPDGDAEVILAECSRLIDELVASAPQGTRRPLGLGVALPGYFHRASPPQVETFAALSALSGLDLSGLSDHFGLPTWIENNSTAAALAEFYRRPDRQAGTLGLINVGYGFSAGFIVGGRLYRGRVGNAGEIGRMYPRGTPRPSVLDLCNTLAAAGHPVTSTRALADLCADPPIALRDWLRRAGRQLAHAMNMIDLIVAPDELVLGGQIPAILAQLLFAEVATAQMDRRDHRIRVSELGPLAAAMGAAFLPLYHGFAPRFGTVSGPE
ncbi:ROK family transcriptional regulator [Roseinatronobacter sp. S2]|uniref:ROK family transcriptional regulator n=1 Tax=Roseinatronobacter sp. S2 TaxID=3035471 RepID=UPI0024104B15|nr:ROK family transcriptional regulator [Roseinatronobacter sp. S2]WFE75795.1 ROK family transcriptional regulator [Roseinatronobacter sp. S2]